MEIVILFFGLLVLGVMALGAWGIFMFFRWAFFGENIKAKKIDRYKEELPQRFNGNETVTWDLPSHSSAPTKEQLISDASEMGYRLDHMAAGQYDQTFIFRKDETRRESRAASHLDSE